MKIAVIGAGLSGLIAARELQTLGHNVDIFEKSRGRGGRLATKRLDWGAADTGAQYFTARDPRFIEEVEHWCNTGVAALWPFTPHKLIDGQLQPSPDDTLRFVGTPNMNSMAHHLADNLSVNLNVQIEQIDRRDSHWSLVDQKQQAWQGYHWVVLAIPAAQAQKLMPSNTLPIASAESLMKPCWALVLGTAGDVNPEIQGVFGDDVISWVSRLSAKPGRTVPGGCDDLWTLHFSPEWSKSHGKDARERVAAIGADWLSHVLGTELAVEHEYLHFWRYAHLDKDVESTSPKVNPDVNIALIGDWCSGGRVEGAYLSAMDLIARHFK
ncbi:FAD-dependent oxidoreductase [Corallincola luteus]|uniref:FAD-dependent oxidoreductase n=1 Tax=Corallincola luteus TaxID=1775177 RepID=A0ABY2AIM5_9GAMM|nr:FAD-dependent oxidoreductase [Corallincola luteus]TCI02346.1 FAD-dependent oxidoreductase [Corallincola luteus]